ncbi:MAG: hypothetical protein IKX22_13000 [Prevotella sp.]|nr:hypothetical protein [Prevotella sp.]
MTRRLFISILFAFVVVAGRSQVKSGLDLCLRDDTTGEWLIGLFDDYAIYDCDYWEYAKVDKNQVVLTKNEQYKEIQLRKNATVIDGKKYKTSVLTTSFMPDYPTKDETAWTNNLRAEEGCFTLRVCIRTTKENVGFLSFINRLINGKQIVEYSKIDERGRFDVKMPVCGPTVMGIRNEFEQSLEHFFSGRLAVENGDTLLLYIDDDSSSSPYSTAPVRQGSKRIYLMGGKYARFNNELLGGDFHPDFVVTDKLTMDSTITQQRHRLEVCQTRIDSLYAARPNLSRRFRTYYQDDIQSQFAYPMLLKCCWPASGENQGELLRKTDGQLNSLHWMRSEVPLMCRDGFTTNIGYYISTMTDIRSKAMTDPDVFLLQLYKEGKVRLTDEEIRKVKDFQDLRARKSGDELLNKAFKTDIIPILGKPLIAQYWDWEQSEQNVPLEINVLNSLDLDDVTREILKTQTFMKDIDGKSHVASPCVLELAHQEIRHPLLIQAIDEANQRIKDFLEEHQRKQTVVATAGEGNPILQRVSEEDLLGITDGQALFERIIAPFRGYVIYVDFWGTWCGPCRTDLEKVPNLKKMLEGMPVVFLYFCNNTPEEARRIYISQNHLESGNAVHYNLPQELEYAIEQYMEVSGFPSYRLVDASGQLMPGSAPRPSNPSAVVGAIEQLLNW